MVHVPKELRFPKFAAAMAAARAANAPQFALHGEAPAPDIRPAVSARAPAPDMPPVAVGGDLPGPRAAPWRAMRAPKQPATRWLGIGGCVLLLALLVTMLMQPIGAEIERMIGPWSEWQQDREAAAPRSDGARATPAEPVARQDEAPAASLPVLAREDPRAPAQPAPAAPPALAAPATDVPTARSVPVPSLKPAPADR